MSKQVYCDKCKREIRVRDDLVTPTIFFEVIPYHEECFAKDLKSIKTLFLDNHPINGFVGNMAAILACVLIPMCFFIDDVKLKVIAAFLIIGLIYRVYSYYVFERHLEK